MSASPSFIGRATGWTARLGGRSGRVLPLIGGTAAAQVITLAATPVLSRLYSPADFGVTATFAAAAGFLAILATARLEFAIPMESDRNGAERLTRAAVTLAALVSVMILLLVVAGGHWLGASVSTPAVARHLWLLPLAVFGIAAFQLGNYRVVREQDYRCLAKTRLWQSICGTVTSTFLGCFHAGPIGLLLGTTLNQSAGALRLLRGLFSLETLRSGWRAAELPLLWSHRGFALKTTLAGILSAFGALLVPVFFSAFYGVDATGSFSMALRLMLLPMTVVGVAVSQAFVGEASKVLRTSPGSFSSLVQNFTRRLLPVATATALAGLVMPWAIPLILGPAWAEAGMLSAILAPMCGLQLLVSPLGMIPIVLKRPGVQLCLDALRALAVLGSVAGAHAAELSPRAAVMCFSGGSVLVYSVMAMVFGWLVRRASIVSGISEFSTSQCGAGKGLLSHAS